MKLLAQVHDIHNHSHNPSHCWHFSVERSHETLPRVEDYRREKIDEEKLLIKFEYMGTLTPA